MLDVKPWDDTFGVGEECSDAFTLAPHETEYLRLETLKSEIVELFIQGDYIMFQIADRILRIEREELYRAEVNQTTGEPYRTMTEYYPDLLSELKQKASLHKLSERQVREYVRLKKVFVDSLGIPERKLLQIGPSHFTELAESMDYDHKTGEVSETPREGKLGKAQVLSMLEQIQDGEWRVADTRAALNEARGVDEYRVRVQWAHLGPHNSGKLYIAELQLVLNGEILTTFTPEQADKFTKRMGAYSNLEQIRGDEGL